MKIAVGIGCDRDTPLVSVRCALHEALEKCQAELADVAAIASIDLKADEGALLQLAEQEGWTIRFYPASALAEVPVPSPSEVVRRHTGTPSVAEAAALLVAGVEQSELLLEKHRYRGADGRNVTLSIARMPE